MTYMLSTLAAAVIPAIALSYNSGLGVSWYKLIFIVYLYSSVGIFIIGTPAHILFDEFDWNNKVPAMCFGAMTGALLVLALSGQNSSVKSLITYSVIGSISGLVYWFVHDGIKNSS